MLRVFSLSNIKITKFSSEGKKKDDKILQIMLKNIDKIKVYQATQISLTTLLFRKKLTSLTTIFIVNFHKSLIR